VDLDVTAIPREELDAICERFAVDVVAALLDTLAEGFGEAPDAVITAAGWRDAFMRNPRPPTPADLAALPSVWRRRVTALTDRIRQVYGRSVLSVRNQLVPAVAPPFDWTDRIEGGPSAAPDWRDLVSEGMPVIPPEAADPIMEVVWRNLTTLGDEMFDLVAAEIQEGARAGESVEAITLRIQRVVGNASWRARRIARTEMNRAANNASLAEMLFSGLDGDKQWRANDDARTRPTHHEANEQTVPLPAPFTVGGFPLLYPGDPTGPPQETINCRCDLTHIVPVDQTPEWARDLGAGPMSPRAGEWPPDTLEEWMTDPVPNDPAFLEWQELTAGAGEFQSDMPAKLKNYWLRGEGAAKIRWGTSGSFDRCVSALRGKFPADTEGLCANLYHEATGHWPGEKKESRALAASADVSTGAMIALVPSAADAARLAVEGGEPIDQLHVTLAYLGDAADYSDDARESIVERLGSHPFTAPIGADAFSINVFNPGTATDRDPCIVMGLSGTELSDVHGWVVEEVARELTEIAPEQHRPWIPHVTLAYTDDLSRVAEFADRVGPITFDHLVVAFAGEYTYIPLGERVPDVAAETIPDIPIDLPQAVWPEGSFETIITVEGLETGDSRAFLPGSLTVAPGPWLEFNWQPRLGEGHDDALLVGRLDEVWRTDDGAIMARGRFDVNGENAQEPMRQVREGFLKGVSVDLDTVVAEQFHDDPDSDDATFTLYHSARIRGATLVTYPAYVETQIWMTEGTPMTPPMTASATPGALVASGEPIVACGCAETYEPPPDEVFADPGFSSLAPITITADGRIFGHGAAWGTCHTGIQGTCRTPPREGEHAYFRLGEVVTASGASVPVGHITMGIGHAPTTAGFSAAAAIEHYDNTRAVVADVASGEDAHGIWISGRIRPGVTEEQKAALRSATLSGDWRSFGGKLRLVALLAVNVPGFPVPRLSTAVSGGKQFALVAAGIPGDAPDRNARSIVMSSLQRRMGRDATTRRGELVSRVHGKG
jgi:2'-5' RNA ligase